jgi:hypothetical protein
METEPTTEKKEHRVFGNPNGPLWKDRVKTTNGGRAKNITWESSVLKYIRPFREKAGWKTTRFCKEVVGAMRLMAGRYEQIKRVLEIWDGYSPKTKGQVFSLDKACDEAQVDRDEFAGLALAAVKQHFRMEALSIVELGLKDLVQASVDYSSKDVKEASAERMRHLEKHGIIDKPVPASTRINVKAASVPALPTRSFDSTMEDFDKAIDGEILSETKLIGDGQ